MISSFRIRGFKRFKNESFFLGRLNLLTGINGVGKTSVIHALLLLQRAVAGNDSYVELNGPYGIELGAFEDVANYDVGGVFELEVKTQDGILEAWQFTGLETDRFASAVRTNQLENPSVLLSGPHDFQYLAAERDGPHIVQTSAPIPTDLLAVGHRGEYTAQVLHHLGTKAVPNSRSADIDPNSPQLLKFQTEAWLSRIVRPIQLDTENFPGTGSYSIRFRVGEEWNRPTNMGFGVTYALPIVVAALTAREGSLLIVENPEAHLHPAGQSQIGLFLATVAASGVQVIVETHSDHVINGIRRAIGEKTILHANDAIVYHFDADLSQAPLKLSFTELGGISSWPKGFFDQYQMDISAITKIRRRK